MTLARILLVLAATGFVALIVWASGAASFAQSFSAITADPWGIVTLADLYLGFLLFALVIAMTEESKWRAVLIVAAMALLGNAVTLIWFAWRLPRLHALLTARS